MLHSMQRRAFWGGLFRLALYLLALGVPIWLYFVYLSPIVKSMESTISSATGKKVELEGQLGEWMAAFEQFRQRFSNGTSTTAQ